MYHSSIVSHFVRHQKHLLLFKKNPFQTTCWKLFFGKYIFFSVHFPCMSSFPPMLQTKWIYDKKFRLNLTTKKWKIDNTCKQIEINVIQIQADCAGGGSGRLVMLPNVSWWQKLPYIRWHFMLGKVIQHYLFILQAWLDSPVHKTGLNNKDNLFWRLSV